MNQEELLKKIGQILDKLNIPYIITGGIAIIVWGRPRFTADIDVVVELKFLHIDRLAEELFKIDKDVYVDKESIKQALRDQGEFNFIHPSSGLKVDFWILKNNIFDRIRMKRRITQKIKGQSINFISPEDLILSKLFWYQETESTRQLEDIESVVNIQEKLDWDYIKKWAREQGTLEVLDKLLDSIQQSNAKRK